MHSAEGAKKYKQGKTLEKCKKHCSKNKKCVAFDFDMSDDPYEGVRCWEFRNPNKVIKPCYKETVDHYTKQECPDLELDLELVKK